jgi:hypothetical protein
MSSKMRRRLFVAAYDAIADECIHTGHVPAAEVLDDRDRCPDCLRQAIVTVQAVLAVLVDEHFDEGADYVYACEALAMDACEVLREIRGES